MLGRQCHHRKPLRASWWLFLLQNDIRLSLVLNQRFGQSSVCLLLLQGFYIFSKTDTRVSLSSTFHQPFTSICNYLVFYSMFSSVFQFLCDNDRLKGRQLTSNDPDVSRMSSVRLTPDMEKSPWCISSTVRLYLVEKRLYRNCVMMDVFPTRAAPMTTILWRTLDEDKLSSVSWRWTLY